MKRILPFLVVALLCFITFNLWIISKQNINIILDNPMRSASQVLALMGIVLMSLTIVISTRAKFIEKILMGLDKAYGIHQIVGSLAFIFILNHPLLLVIQALPQVKLTAMYLLPSLNIAYTLGIFALYAMILSFVFIVFIKLPYDLWKLTHKLLGLAFLLGSIHSLLIGSDMSTFFPLRIWIGSFIAIGSISVIYSLFFYRIFAPKFSYRVERIEKAVDVITLYLSPETNKTINFEPGQFVYVEFKNKKIGRELHPFSIASSSNKEYVQLSAKIVGDYTLKLTQYLEEGNMGLLYGPYGQFAKYSANFKNCIWIAGGIGVTPFLSMLSSESHILSDRTINFYYTYSKKEEATFLEQINAYLSSVSHVKFFDWCTKEKNRLSVEVIKSNLDLNIVDAIFLCGPLAMMEGLKKQFMQAGIAEQKIFYENFSFIS